MAGRAAEIFDARARQDDHRAHHRHPRPMGSYTSFEVHGKITAQLTPDSPTTTGTIGVEVTF